MNIRCPLCGFSKSIDESRVPDRPVKATCPRCRESFTFRPQSNPQAEAAEPFGAPGPRQTCRACGLGQPAGETCLGCGADLFQGQEEGRSDEAATVSKAGIPAVATAVGEAITEPRLLPKAGFWTRVVAALLDSMAVGFLQVVLSLLLGFFIAALGNGAPEFQRAMTTVITLFTIALSAGYYVFFTGYCGQTPGKMALRIKVIRTDGAEISYGRAFFREVIGKFVSGIIFGIGYLMVAFDEQKQGLHDRLANTYVIKL